jgi:hypothetical protein
VVFTHLLQVGHLLGALERSGVITCQTSTTAPTLLLWGTPIGSGIRGPEIQNRLIELCDCFGEKPDRRSEPDVIVDLGEVGFVFIEVKYRSGNDWKPADYDGWSRYERAPRLGWRIEDVKASGCYELARNWCLLKNLAANKPATLVNLGPATLFSSQKNGARLGRFVSALGTDERSHFRQVTWPEFLGKDLRDDWFGQFCRCRGLVPSLGQTVAGGVPIQS